MTISVGTSFLTIFEASFVFRLAKARTSAAYLALEEELCALPNSPGAIAYLGTHDIKKWVRHRFSYPRFGHATSNIAESLNNVLLRIRGLPPLKIVNEIWLSIMATHYKRQLSKHRGFLPNYFRDKYEKRLKEGPRNTIYGSENIVWQLESLRGERFAVHKEEGERNCKCLSDHEFQLPCSVLRAVIKVEKLRVEDFFDELYLIKTYRGLYSENIYPLNIRCVMPSAGTKTPAFRAQKGRPGEKRFRKESLGSNKRNCGKCKRLCRPTKGICLYPGATEEPAQEEDHREVVEGEEEVDDGNALRPQLEWETAQRLVADLRQRIHEANRCKRSHSTAGGLSSAGRSSITNPWGSKSKKEDKKEVLAPLRVKPSLYLVPWGIPRPESQDTTARSSTRARTREAQGLGSNV